MIKNTLGISHIKTAVIVLAVSMLLSAVLTYASLMTVVGITRDNTIRVLDSFVMHNSTEIYDSIHNYISDKNWNTKADGTGTAYGYISSEN